MNNKMAVTLYLLIITLNVSRLNAQIKEDSVVQWIK